jgi:predicted DNA-binding protein (MmcQ/YjbR family)
VSPASSATAASPRPPDAGRPALADDPRDRLRAICLALPEAEERETWGDPTWRVRDRIFAMEKRGDGRISVWLKAPPGAQDVLVAAEPLRFFVPPYVGHRGWIGVRLDASPDWEQLAALVARSFRLTAPKRLAARLDP